MKYQVSCDMTFPSITDRDAVCKYLDGKRDLAFTMPGDMLASDDPTRGGYRVACLYRLDSEADWRETDRFLHDCIKVAEFGYIERHLCRHDEGLPCEGREAESWGDTHA
jgi:hypothetical protein